MGIQSLDIAKRLSAEGLSREQSEAIAREIVQASDIARGEALTEETYRAENSIFRGEVENEFKLVREEMSSEFKLVREEMSSEFKLVREEMISEFKLVREEMRSLREELNGRFESQRFQILGGFFLVAGFFFALDRFLT